MNKVLLQFLIKNGNSLVDGGKMENSFSIKASLWHDIRFVKGAFSWT